jgi:hypothetical protein
VCNFGFFWPEWTSLKLEWNESFQGPRVPKKVQITQERVEYNVFLFDEPLKGSKSLKIFAWRFVLTSCQIYQNPFTQEKILKFWVSNKKNIFKPKFISLTVRRFLCHFLRWKNVANNWMSIGCSKYKFIWRPVILSVKNGGNDNVQIEDNCLEEERSDDSKYCLRSVHCH